GIGFELQPGDVAIRCNFCTIDQEDRITDRRAGRISSEESAPLAISLRKIQIPGIEIFVEPVKEHRFVVVFRGKGLGGNVADTDPQRTGVKALDPVAQNEESKKTAEVAKEFLRQARAILAGHAKANFHTMRGFAAKPQLPSYREVYGLRAAAIAVYPMYKGLARLVGMDIVGKAQTLAEQIDELRANWDRY
ncbi:MAG: phosphoglycerate mutase, partial [Pirellula sp.]